MESKIRCDCTLKCLLHDLPLAVGEGQTHTEHSKLSGPASSHTVSMKSVTPLQGA